MNFSDIEIFKNKKVLVTGHTGFKGSWLTIWLKLLGANVVGVSLDPYTSKDNFVLTEIGKEIIDLRSDIRNYQELLKIFKRENPQIVFHLAAQPLVLESYKSPRYTFETNIQGTVNILEACRYTKSVKAVVVITSDKCYHNNEWMWGYREIDTLGGHDPYSASKAAAELVVSSYRDSFVLKENLFGLASARAGNVFGGGDWAENRIIPDCIRAIENNKPIFLRNPNATRPWQHVLEPLSGYLLLAARMLGNPTDFSEAWNFGPEMDAVKSVASLVAKLVKKWGSGEWIEQTALNKPHEAGLLALDISKARYKLGWKPTLSFDQAIAYTVDWYKNYHTENILELCQNQIQGYMDQWNSSNES